MSSSLVPWHMWGSSKTVEVPLPSSGGNQFQQSVQLAKIAYKRPENWRFLFGFVFESGPDSIALNNINVIVDFDLTVGVGRSAMKLQEFQTGGTSGNGGSGFCRLGLQYNTVGAAQAGRTKWTTIAPSPILDETAAPPINAERQFLSLIPAENIQCSARVSVTAVAATQVPTRVTVHSYFSPNVHVRPDWHQLTRSHEDHMRQFTGKEILGQ